MKIGNFDLDKEILIIAEIGNNHEGSYTLAEEMIGLAAEAGAGAVKFQTIIPEKLVSLQQTERINQLRKFQLSYDQFEKLSSVAINAGVLFLSTPFDLESAIFLNNLVPAFKIASGDNRFYPLIKVIAETGKPIILSTGGVDINQINKSLNFIVDVWNDLGIHQQVALLHCVISYPTPTDQANLAAINELRKLVSTVGYSDHTLGIDAAVYSVILGARIIEKHFTIDKNHSTFRDHQLSADPAEFKELTMRVKIARKMLGDDHKIPQDCEMASLEKVRRSIVANKNLMAGTTLSWNELGWVRPGGGLEPGRESEIIGKTLNHDLLNGELILLNNVK